MQIDGLAIDVDVGVSVVAFKAILALADGSAGRGATSTEKLAVISILAREALEECRIEQRTEAMLAELGEERGGA